MFRSSGFARRAIALSQSKKLSSSLEEFKPSIVGLKANFRKRLDEARQAALIGGGQKRIDAQHSKGKLTARERIDLLLDDGTFREFDMLKTHRCDEFGMEKDQIYGDGVVTGQGFIHGRKVNSFKYFFPHCSMLIFHSY